MKKVLCVFRDGYDAKYICSQLERCNGDYIFYYIIESGKTAKRAKIMRMIKRNNIFTFFINAFFLALYDFDMAKRMKNILGDQQYPKGLDAQRIDDVNEDKCIKLCNELQPNIVMIYGTGILKKETLEAVRANIYNIHSSILPYYRNVHSDFWAYRNADFARIGITIFRLNTGIDTGDIAIQKQAGLAEEASLEEYKVQNLRNIPQLIQEFLQMFFSGDIQYVQQNNVEASIAITPMASDILDFWKKRKK